MASGKEIRISITSALNAAGIEATKQQVDAMGKSVAKSMADAASGNRKHWADIKAAWDLGCTAIRKAWQGVTAGLRSAFKFETQTTQFKTLVGNIDEARAHMADLKALGDTPPFSLDEFAKASRSLMVMTDGALGYKKSLELIGDAAAATGIPIEELGQAVGRMYAMIRDGQPLARAVTQLRNMGVITPEVAQKLQDLQAAGKSNAEIWAEVEAQLGKYKGAMAETEKTGDGLVSAIQSRWDNIVRTFGQAVEKDAKGGLAGLLDEMKKLEEDGHIDLFAEKTSAAVGKIIEAVKTLTPAVSTVWNSVKFAFDAVGSEIGRFAGALSMGEFADAFGGIGKETARAWTDAFDPDGTQQAKDDKRLDELKTKRAEARQKKEADDAKREAEEKKRIEENLAAAQKKQDEKRIAETAEKEAKAKEEAAKKAAATQERLDREASAQRQRLAEKELNDKIKAHQKLLQAENDAATDARSAKSAAESKLQQAWGWYRDKDSMAAQMAEEKADAAARKQYEADFEKLKSKHRDWRTVENLSVDEEATRRVALAKEEKEAADKHLAEIEKNTAELAEKLDELLSVKG